MNARAQQKLHEKVSRLNASYKRVFAQLGRDGLNEAETRLRFLDNLFRALGWDIGNPETSRVRVEPKHRDGFPDYQLSLKSGLPIIFVEAKRAVDPTKDFPKEFRFTREEIFQAKRYAYMNGVPFAILSNYAFTQVFAVTRPPDLLSPSDQSISEFTLTPKSTETQWKRFGEFFSLEGVDSGRINDLLDVKTRKERQPVTLALLTRMLKWRKQLGTAYLLINPSATDEDIDTAATTLIDKLLFTRILIDRRLEDENLFSHVLRGNSVYRDLSLEFTRLDGEYNGMIYAHQPPATMRHPDDVIARILRELNSKMFEFDMAWIPIEILGDIYETFIGVKLRRKTNTTMVLEVSETLKKQHGVYFTPPNDVKMMVSRVLGERLNNATDAAILKLRVVDPACGSGTFLIAAYRMLLDAALNSWKDQPRGPKRKKAITIYDDREVLSIQKKREILTTCIFGVDLDARALDIASLSLYLILMDDNSRNGILIAGTALPSLAGNLVQGNSLVDKAEITNHPIRWEQTFLEVFKRGGFDVVVTNPPYVFGEHVAAEEKEFLKTHYAGIGDQPDLYAAFLELAVRRLCKPGGAYAFIIPDAILAREQREAIRSCLLEHGAPRVIAHVGTVFTKLEVKSIDEPKLTHDNTGVSAVIIIGVRDRIALAIDLVEETEEGQWATVNKVPILAISKDQWKRFLIYVLPQEWAVLERLWNNPTIESVLRVADDAKGVSRGEEVGKRNLFASSSREAKVPVIAGEAITPYHLENSRFYVKALEKDTSCYAAPKILVRKTDDRLFACAEMEGEATLQSAYNLQIRDDAFFAVLAVLNFGSLSVVPKKDSNPV